MGNTSKINTIDQWNTILVAISAFLAWAYPYRAFLLAFAVLGPLHYLTEIHWIRTKNYFVNAGMWKWMALVSALAVALPQTVFGIANWVGLDAQNQLPLIANFSQWTDVLLLMGLCLAFLWVSGISRNRIWILGLMVVGIGLILNGNAKFHLAVGMLLPTVIHVYLFTLLFMLYGAVRNRSKWGYISIGALLLAPILLVWLPTHAPIAELQSATKDSWLQVGFHVLNTGLRHLLGWSDGTTFFFYEQGEVKMQSLLTFAYIYHYLNWFSKTTVIHWHQQITAQSAPIIGLLWGVMMALFAYNYLLGFYIAIIFSFLHVFYEFPVNAHSIRGIVSGLKRS